MAKLYGVVDCGGTQERIAVLDGDMWIIGAETGLSNPGDYTGTVQRWADTMHRLAEGRGELVAASIAVAGEVNDGRLVRAGALTPWVGNLVGIDTADALAMPPERVGLLNDMEAVARSQQAVNWDNNLGVDGLVTTLSTGWGGARFYGDGGVKGDEPGHQFLRDGATCPCGEAGHAEAFISGKGIQLNHEMPAKDFLKDPAAADQFVADVSTATVAMLERHRNDGFNADEIRWMGGVATGQPLLMRRVFDQTKRQLHGSMPTWEMVTMGDQAGLHGSFADARRLAMTS